MFTFIDGMVSYILGANWRYIFRIWKWSFFHTVDIGNISIHISQPHDSNYQVLHLSLLSQRCWEIALVGFCHNFPGFQAQVHVETLTMEYYSHESCEIISKIISNNLQLRCIYWPSEKRPPPLFGMDSHFIKLTRTGQINQHLPYLHYTPWKDLALVCLHVFFSAFDHLFADETGFSKK